jgi:hypothetical protein
MVAGLFAGLFMLATAGCMSHVMWVDFALDGSDGKSEFFGAYEPGSTYFCGVCTITMLVVGFGLHACAARPHTPPARSGRGLSSARCPGH